MPAVITEDTVELLALSDSGNRLAPKSRFRVQTHPMISIILSGSTLTIAGLIMGAALVSGVHHFFLVFLDGRQVEEQFWMKNTSNALSIVVQTLCVASVSVSLTQLVCITIYYCEQISYIPRRSGGSSAAGPLLLHSWISYSAYQDTYPLSA